MDEYECINQCTAVFLEGNKPRNLDCKKVARYIVKIGHNCVVYAGIEEDWDNTAGIIYETMVKLFMERRVQLVNGAHRL